MMVVVCASTISSMWHKTSASVLCKKVWDMRRLASFSLMLFALLGLGHIVGGSPPAMAQEELSRALSRMAPVVGRPQEYQRKGAESIYRIARRFDVSANAVHNANESSLNAGGEKLRIPGQHIVPVAGASGIVINLPERNLYLYRDGEPPKVYPIAIGMRGWETPTGSFKIANKRKNPTWFPPKWAVQEEPVPPGPDNPLGDRWMGLSAPGYGIHATNAPASVGRYASHGCMRMYPENARDLYAQVGVGTPVRIIYERAVIGYLPDDGIVYLAYHPDPYQDGDVAPEDVRDMLKDYGLESVADLDVIGDILKRPTGMPTPVVGSHTTVTVNGKRVAFALAPVPVNSDWLVPAGPLARALGAGTQIGPRLAYVVIERGDRRLFFSPGSPEALVNRELIQVSAAPRIAAGYPLVPIRTTAEALGASVQWDEASREIRIWDGIGRMLGTL